MAQRSLLTRALWFVVVGWWATPVAVNVAWLLNATIVGIPLGVKLLNLVPTVLTLAEPRTRDPDAGRGQHSLAVRARGFRKRSRETGITAEPQNPTTFDGSPVTGVRGHVAQSG